MTFVKIFLGVVVCFVVLLLIFVFNAFRASYARNKKLNKMIAHALEAVRNNDDNAKRIIHELAAEPATRNHLFQALKDIGTTELFPQEFLTEEKLAESDLVKWLMHGNELAAAPSEVELVKKLQVSRNGRNGSMYLFKFRTESPHWAAHNGWMAGLAGPFWENEDIREFRHGDGTFSELDPFDSMAEEEHLERLQKALKGLVIRC